MSDTVELRIAFHWHCESCGELNFVLPIRREFTEDQAREYYRQHRDLEDWSELPEGWDRFVVSMIPDVVTCSVCGHSFDAVDEEDV